MVLFLVLPLGGFAYVLWHVWCLLSGVPAARWAVVSVLLLPLLALVLNFSGATDRMPMWLARTCYQVGTSSLFVLMYAVFLFLLLDIGRLAHVLPRSALHGSWSLLLLYALVLVVVFVLGNVWYNLLVPRFYHETTYKQVPVTTDIVMMSDLHLGYANGPGTLRKWVDEINRSHPDLVLIAGDVIDGSMRPLEDGRMAAELRRIKAPKYGCFGNHEHYAGAEAAARFYREAGITLLRDSVAYFNGMAIVGREDRSAGRRKPLAELMKGVGKDKYVILLDHQPYHLEQAERAGVDLQFSGHTHYGQVWPISWITDAVYECAWGTTKRGNTRYYVSSGIGLWGGKFRIGTYSEYIDVLLQRLDTVHYRNKFNMWSTPPPR